MLSWKTVSQKHQIHMWLKLNKVKQGFLAIPWLANVERSIPLFDQILICPSSPAKQLEK